MTKEERNLLSQGALPTAPEKSASLDSHLHSVYCRLPVSFLELTEVEWQPVRQEVEEGLRLRHPWPDVDVLRRIP